MKGYLYILRSKQSGRYYIGSTLDVNRRLSQHRRGHTLTTKRLGVFSVELIQEFSNINLARRVERKIKSWKRKDFIAKIIKEGGIRKFD